MKSKNYFDRIALDWDRLRESFFSERVREKAFSIANMKPDQIAVDIGARSGFITEGLIQRGIRVIAVDQSEAMITEMKGKFSSFEGIDYRLGEAEILPIADETVDYVFANMFLHHIESPISAIKEMVRILKPGGMIILTDLDEHHFRFLKIEHHDHWMGFKREEIKKWFEEAGLQNVKVDCVG